MGELVISKFVKVMVLSLMVPCLVSAADCSSAAAVGSSMVLDDGLIKDFSRKLSSQVIEPLRSLASEESDDLIEAIHIIELAGMSFVRLISDCYKYSAQKDFAALVDLREGSFAGKPVDQIRAHFIEAVNALSSKVELKKSWAVLLVQANVIGRILDDVYVLSSGESGLQDAACSLVRCVYKRLNLTLVSYPFSSNEDIKKANQNGLAIVTELKKICNKDLAEWRQQEAALKATFEEYEEIVRKRLAECSSQAAAGGLTALGVPSSACAPSVLVAPVLESESAAGAGAVCSKLVAVDDCAKVFSALSRKLSLEVMEKLKSLASEESKGSLEDLYEVELVALSLVELISDCYKYSGQAIFAELVDREQRSLLGVPVDDIEHEFKKLSSREDEFPCSGLMGIKARLICRILKETCAEPSGDSILQGEILSLARNMGKCFIVTLKHGQSLSDAAIKQAEQDTQKIIDKLKEICFCLNSKDHPSLMALHKRAEEIRENFTKDLEQAKSFVARRRRQAAAVECKQRIATQLNEIIAGLGLEESEKDPCVILVLNKIECAAMSLVEVIIWYYNNCQQCFGEDLVDRVRKQFAGISVDVIRDCFTNMAKAVPCDFNDYELSQHVYSSCLADPLKNDASLRITYYANNEVENISRILDELLSRPLCCDNIRRLINNLESSVIDRIRFTSSVYKYTSIEELTSHFSHTKELLSRLRSTGMSVGFDLDPAEDKAKELLFCRLWWPGLCSKFESDIQQPLEKQASEDAVRSTERDNIFKLIVAKMVGWILCCYLKSELSIRARQSIKLFVNSVRPLFEKVLANLPAAERRLFYGILDQVSSECFRLELVVSKITSWLQSFKPLMGTLSEELDMEVSEIEGMVELLTSRLK